MKHDMIFEVLPYTKTASEKYADKVTDRIVDVVNELKNVSILNVPEIIDENHIGKPYYRNTDIRKFASILRERCNKDIMVNTVVVHYNSKEKFEQWLAETVNRYGINNFVFVGAKIDSFAYPGPSVSDANIIARNKKSNFGNIFIPTRENEADRLVSKTASGCNFFTSQVLFERDKVLDVIKEYSIKCEKENLNPAKFFLSFSPVSSLEDITFVKWLGVEIKEETENRLKNSPNIGEESIKIIMELITKVYDSIEEANLKINVGLQLSTYARLPLHPIL